MSRRTAAWLAWSILALAALLGMLGCLLLFLSGGSPPLSVGYTLAFLSFLIVGVVIAYRKPENPIGWMFCVIGLASVWDFFAYEYALYTLVTQPGALPGGVWMAWSRFWTATIVWELMFFALLLFPNGRLPSLRWRPLAWVAAVVFTLVGVLFAFESGRVPEMRVPNPAGIEQAAGIIEMSMNILTFATLGIIVATAVSVVVRFRQARGEERQQLKWLAYAVSFLGTLVGVGILNSQVLHNSLIESIETVLGGVDILPVAVASVPVAIGVAILRYRLYDIDVVINRTLVYGALTATLVVLYFVGVVVLQRVFVVLTGQKSTLAIVASTLLIAALFNPLRRHIQSFIDRRFYRRKYDSRRTLEAFSAKLRDETDLDALNNELVGVVRETMQPAHVSMWLRPNPGPQEQRAD